MTSTKTQNPATKRSPLTFRSLLPEFFYESYVWFLFNKMDINQYITHVSFYTMLGFYKKEKD